jgi:hypothetical protein
VLPDQHRCRVATGFLRRPKNQYRINYTLARWFKQYRKAPGTRPLSIILAGPAPVLSDRESMQQVIDKYSLQYRTIWYIDIFSDKTEILVIHE